jgi:hypothetical protein
VTVNTHIFLFGPIKQNKERYPSIHPPPADIVPHHAVKLLGSEEETESQAAAVGDIDVVLVIFTLVSVHLLTKFSHH